LITRSWAVAVNVVNASATAASVAVKRMSIPPCVF
jgi:hypothetical protein